MQLLRAQLATQPQVKIFSSPPSHTRADATNGFPKSFCGLSARATGGPDDGNGCERQGTGTAKETNPGRTCSRTGQRRRLCPPTTTRFVARSNAPTDTLTDQGPFVELSGSFLLSILVANALVDRGVHLSTDLTPDPSFHFKSIPARFLFLSFRQPGTGLYYKGREYVSRGNTRCFRPPHERATPRGLTPPFLPSPK